MNADDNLVLSYGGYGQEFELVAVSGDGSRVLTVYEVELTGRDIDWIPSSGSFRKTKQLNVAIGRNNCSQTVANGVEIA